MTWLESKLWIPLTTLTAVNEMIKIVVSDDLILMSLTKIVADDDDLIQLAFDHCASCEDETDWESIPVLHQAAVNPCPSLDNVVRLEDAASTWLRQGVDCRAEQGDVCYLSGSTVRRADQADHRGAA